MMTYKDFFEIATYCNKAWRGNFTPAEIADNARIYYEEYKESECAGDVIQSLLIQLFEDGSDEALTFISKMCDGDQGGLYTIENKISDLDTLDDLDTLGDIIAKLDKLGFYGYGDIAFNKIHEIREAHALKD